MTAGGSPERPGPPAPAGEAPRCPDCGCAHFLPVDELIPGRRGARRLACRHCGRVLSVRPIPARKHG